MSDPATRLRDARIAAGFKTATDAAKYLGVSAPTYSSNENGSRGVTPEKARLYARAFKVTPEWILYGKGAAPIEVANGEPPPEGASLVHIYDIVASAGHGAIVDAEEHVSNLAFSTQYLREMTSAKGTQLAAIRVKGDSMSPTIQDDDMVAIDMTKTNLDYDGLFVIRVGEALQIKRIGRGSKRTSVMVIADNTLYPPVDTERSEIDVVGKVIWYGRKV